MYVQNNLKKNNKRKSMAFSSVYLEYSLLKMICQ